MNRKIRTAIATLAALVALSATGLTGVASGASRVDELGGTVATHVVVGVTAELEVVPTGDGSATEEDCHEFEVEINELRVAAIEHMGGLPFGEYDPVKATEENQQAESLEDDALSAGCMIIY